MKKKLLFTFACVMALMAGFVSCTNDDFEEFAPVAEMQKSAMTRAVGGMTQEEVQARLDELGEKYGININMLYVRDYSEFTESTFEKMEQNIIAAKNRDTNTDINTIVAENSLLDDSEIDEYGITTLSTELEYVPEFEVSQMINIRYEWEENDRLRYDNFQFLFGINFKTEFDRLKATEGFVENKIDECVHSCELKDFSHGTIYIISERKYFNFEFSANFKRTINDKDSTNTAIIYGLFNDGISHLYTQDSGIDINFTI